MKVSANHRKSLDHKTLTGANQEVLAQPVPTLFNVQRPLPILKSWRIQLLSLHPCPCGSLPGPKPSRPCITTWLRVKRLLILRGVVMLYAVAT
jgi:hypothetical protein